MIDYFDEPHYEKPLQKHREDMMNKADAVNHPGHYGGEDNPYEAIKVIEAWELDFCLGNVVKYISRAGKKGEWKHLEDLKKAQWYLNREISRIEKFPF
jgi:hypothetical protein